MIFSIALEVERVAATVAEPLNELSTPRTITVVAAAATAGRQQQAV